MSDLTAHDHLMVAEEDVAAVMLHFESRDVQAAREQVNLVAAEPDGVTRLAWMVVRLADTLYRQERANERLMDRGVA